MLDALQRTQAWFDRHLKPAETGEHRAHREGFATPPS
jgi:hypothetical protein